MDKIAKKKNETMLLLDEDQIGGEEKIADEVNLKKKKGD
eukprot:CAMPEP_0170488084 /NCGR_PEP_ID=MMETSP0208-20121228/6704_1 /TAXON_ID=197538 /ORGANISM="Strombidium inclinatum, Strain S3" /LENGTH=38 /DNA_ID= /DNA_START= /DNA_END= /DNA_ORIENTATION=